MSTENQKTIELENQLKRCLADYDNLKKRFEKESREVIRFANEVLLLKLMEIAGNLEKAEALAPAEIRESSFFKGLTTVSQSFKQLLQGEGLTEIEVKVGEKFNPFLHEAVEVAEGEEDDSILEITSSGFKLNEKVVRPVKVKISKKAISQEAQMKVEEFVNKTGNYA